MSAQFPAPDPHESFELLPTGGQRLPAPVAMFVGAPATPEGDRLADRLLDLRPGVLVVVGPS